MLSDGLNTNNSDRFSGPTGPQLERDVEPIALDRTCISPLKLEKFEARDPSYIELMLQRYLAEPNGLVLAIQAREMEIAQALLDHGATKLPLDAASTNQIETSLRSALQDELGHITDFEEVSASFTLVLKILNTIFGRQKTAEILNTTAFLAGQAVKTNNTTVLSQLSEAGLDFFSPPSGRSAVPLEIFSRPRTWLLYAAIGKYFQASSFFAKLNPKEVNIQEETRGDTALNEILRTTDNRNFVVELKESGKFQEEFLPCIKTLLAIGADPAIKNKSGLDGIYFCLRSQCPELLPMLARHAPSLDQLSLYDPYYRREIDRDEITAGIARLLPNLPKENLKELLEHIYPYGGLAHVYLYLKAREEALNLPKRFFGFCFPPNKGLYLNQLLPHLINGYKFGAFSQLLQNIERYFDHNIRVRGHHPNQAEMLALLSHDDAFAPGEERNVGVVTAAITSPFRFLDYISRATQQMVDNWMRIGIYTFSFRLWRYEAKRIMQDGALVQLSLLEQYGFTRVSERKTDRKYGSGYVIMPGQKHFTHSILNGAGVGRMVEFDPETRVEFRRAYIMVSHPSHGTLLIRNSSPEFGRNTMRHPAYLSERGWNSLSEHELLNPSPDKYYSNFKNVLRRSLNRYHKFLHSSLEFLLDQLEVLRIDIAAWKFDTRLDQAWQDFGEPLLVGGFNSPGFELIVNQLLRLSNVAGEMSMPDLAFVNPAKVPITYHKFVTWRGEQETLKLDHDTLIALENLCRGASSDAELSETGIREFISAGLDAQAELILVRPRNNS